ncbi:alpha/beta hydrolase-fold protein, partial [Rhodococcus sp. IEGM 1379]|uniref:alpha/beta hydrolase n=1 Tax=Rhodococcus sp. IEGM 1379 TaxID=3047086 RepID=UPI0024B7A70C
MRARTFKRGRLVAAIAAVSVLPMLISPAMSSADSGVTATDTATATAAAAKVNTTGSKLTSKTTAGGKTTIKVFSPSMGRDIPVEVLTPTDTTQQYPTLYLLNGAGGGEDSATWQRNADVMNFFRDKKVNVVTPIQGAFSYYTDWEKPDPALGVQKWQTFLTKELPPVINDTFNTNGVQSISAISMTATS